MMNNPADNWQDERVSARANRLRGLKMQIWIPPIVGFGLIILAWQLYAVHNPYIIPTVPQIVDQYRTQPGLYWHDTLVTLQEAVVGASCGMAGAFLLAILMSRVRVLERALMPLAVVLNVTPMVAIAPGLVVAFGFGFTPKYIIAGMIVFFPFLINSLIGLRSPDPEVLDVFTTLHASWWEVLWHLELPTSLPYLFAAARICLPLSLIGAVVAEFSAAGQTTGLGSLIETAANQADLKAVYASVVVLALLGVGVTFVVVLFQRRLLSWHHSSRSRSQ
ncbi:MAG TPA: ABC transporter permease [Acidimicrobiales bacterium]|nr:ABC transporter permease [Acidimicrobiales bacterium]